MELRYIVKQTNKSYFSFKQEKYNLCNLIKDIEQFEIVPTEENNINSFNCKTKELGKLLDFIQKINFYIVFKFINETLKENNTNNCFQSYILDNLIVDVEKYKFYDNLSNNIRPSIYIANGLYEFISDECSNLYECKYNFISDIDDFLCLFSYKETVNYFIVFFKNYQSFLENYKEI